jgi:hypothetical protein
LTRHYNNTASVALRLVPFSEALIVEEVETRTMDVLTVKDAAVAPAGTNTVGGTPAAPLLLESEIVAPPAEAARFKVTVPVDDCNPPTTLEGFNDNEAIVSGGSGTGVTVSEADLVTPL